MSEPSPSSPTAAMPAGAALLQATIRDLTPALMAPTNLGESGDRQDLYWLIDYLCFAVDQAYPGLPCKNGCFECCTTNVFRVTALEWEAVQRGLAKLPPERRAAIYAAARAVFGDKRAALEGVAAQWTALARPDPADYDAVALACPMLDGGRCSIYDDRPAICRGYGYSSARVNGTSSLLLCHTHGPAWMAALDAQGYEQLPMPSWNPVQATLEQLNEGRPIKPLPLWLLDDPAAPPA